jgi:hypothetical protein
MKSFIYTILALFIISSISAIEVSGTQSGTWTEADNPYLLVGDVTVPAGAVLTIEPGVIVRAMGNFRINAEGSIQAVGTEADSIRFENGQTPPTNLWKGLRLENESVQSNFMHIVVEYAEYGVNAVDSPIEVSYSRFSHNQRGLHLYGIGNPDPAPMNVHHNIIEHTMQNGILIPQNSNAWVHHNEVRYNGTVTQYYGAIQLANQSTGGQNNPIIEHNYIHHNYKQGITAWDVVGAGAINATIRNNHIEANLTGIYLLNASGIVHDNLIINNFIPGDTNSGAGMMIGGATSTPYIAGNTLTGNFTGFYITSNAMPCLGDLAENHPFAYGMNIIQDNIDESNTLHSVVCASYPNSGNVIKAENNDWGVYTVDEIEIGIMDQNDSMALPIVDFEPWYQSQTGFTISGTFSWDPDDYDFLLPEELELLIVDTQSRQIVERHTLSDNPFEIQSEVEGDFYALITGLDPEREIWAAAGGLDAISSFSPGVSQTIDLGDIYINAWQHYDVQVKGPSEPVGDYDVWPLSQGFLIFEYDKVDYFYDIGNFRYIYKQDYRDADGWHTVQFPDLTMYARIGNLNHGAQWEQSYAVDGEIVNNIVSYYLDDNLKEIFSTVPAQGDGWSSRRYHDDDGDLFYEMDPQGYCVKHYKAVNVGDDTWHLLHKSNPSHPVQLSLRSVPDGPEQQFHMEFWWQAPAYDNLDYNEYRLYSQHQGHEPQLLATIDYSATPIVALENLTGSGYVDFWVVASDGNNESEPSNVVTFNFPIANEDLVRVPEINIYPNPVSLKGSSVLQVEVKGLKQPLMKIYNLRGQQVLRAEMQDDHFSWNGKNSRGKAVSSGVYFMRIEDANRAVLNRKILVTK